jgi:teichuronic acid biosynthesis glycosyltransferase TuaH
MGAALTETIEYLQHGDAFGDERCGSEGTRALGRRDSVVTFSYMTLDGAARRGWFMPEDRFVQSALAEERLGRVLIADTLRRAPASLKALLSGRDGTDVLAAGRAELVQPFRLWGPRPTSMRGVQRAYRGYGDAMRRAAARMGLVDPVVITANPFVAGFADLSWAAAVTYYAVDDWTLLNAYRQWRPLYVEAYEQIRVRRCRVAAVTGALRDRLAVEAPSVVVPNGLEPTEWEGQPTPPPYATDDDRPILVYAGTLDGRLDYCGVAQIAAAIPDARVLLVGSVADGALLEGVDRIPNVELHSALGRSEYAGLLRSASVGLIPHHATELTSRVEPQKIYEYLAAGLPVVATDLLPMRGIDPRVRLVTPETADYGEAVRAALRLGRASETERLGFVRANSWRARHRALIDMALT